MKYEKIHGLTYSEGNPLEPFKPKSDWSIYNNELPMGELSDEQAVQLFLAHRRGEAILFKAPTTQVLSEAANPKWLPSVIYRVEKKSERDEFVERCIQNCIQPESQTAKELFGLVFDAIKSGEIKAPEVDK